MDFQINNALSSLDCVVPASMWADNEQEVICGEILRVTTQHQNTMGQFVESRFPIVLPVHNVLRYTGGFVRRQQNIW